jgi:sugar lactone lactonase YvrE
MRLRALLAAGFSLWLSGPNVGWGVQPHDDLPQPEAVKAELYATGFELADGPTFDAAGNLYVVNYRRMGTIGRITPDGAASIWCDLVALSPIEGRVPQASGLKVDALGRLVVADAGGGRLLRVSEDGAEVEVLADRFGGQRFHAIDDVALDSLGNVYFIDPGTAKAENPAGSVYLYDLTTKKVTQLDTGLAGPSGVAVSPDQKHLCVSESERYCILIYDLSESREVMNGRELIQFRTAESADAETTFVPGGLIFDERSRLYAAMWESGVINVIDIGTGELVRQYDAGGPQVSNLHFRGSYLYSTVVAKEAVFRLKLDVRGYAYNAGQR